VEIKIVSEKTNPLLKRREVQFRVDQEKPASTAPRREIRKAVADKLKVNVDLVFIRKVETKTGTHTAFGTANLYDSVEQAKIIEPVYIVKRNVPPEKPEEEKKE
jgi:small subunit ribosomal protein S24e